MQLHVLSAHRWRLPQCKGKSTPTEIRKTVSVQNIMSDKYI
jgi:hypothetical protein